MVEQQCIITNDTSMRMVQLLHSEAAEVSGTRAIAI